MSMIPALNEMFKEMQLCNGVQDMPYSFSEELAGVGAFGQSQYFVAEDQARTLSADERSLMVDGDEAERLELVTSKGLEVLDAVCAEMWDMINS